MGLIKCPRCELNYIKVEDRYCNVCKREMKGEEDKELTIEICPECGENPVVPGEELCLVCMREKKRQENMEKLLDGEEVQDDIELESVTVLEEMVMPLTEDIPPAELQEIDKELGIEDQDQLGYPDVDPMEGSEELDEIELDEISELAGDDQADDTEEDEESED